MNDDVDKQSEDAAEEPAGPLGGERLAEARREQQISVHEIAKELHLDEHKVRALERNEFDVLGAPVFAKGHLKKYSQLVGVNADDVMADYYQLNRAASIPPVISARQRPRQELSPGPWIAVIVVVVLAVTVYWWFSSPADPDPDPGSAEVQQDLLPAEESPGAVAPSGTTAEPSESPAERIPATPVEVEPEAVPQDEETSSPEIVPGQMRMLLTYTGDCWTEITDATGRRLFFDLGRDGRTVELNGAEPFNVLFGSPANVLITVNGGEYELPPIVRPDRPMRLTISGS